MGRWVQRAVRSKVSMLAGQAEGYLGRTPRISIKWRLSHFTHVSFPDPDRLLYSTRTWCLALFLRLVKGLVVAGETA